MLPKYLKERNPKLIVAQFWHIPWPNPETFRVFPWTEEILDGLLGNDLLGFHLRYHCQNFLTTVDRTIEARIDQETSEVIRGGKSTVVRPFPNSIDFERAPGAGRQPCGRRCHGAVPQAVAASGQDPRSRDGADRLHQGDSRTYPAIDQFLEDNSAYRERWFSCRWACQAGNWFPSTRPSTSKSTGLSRN